MAQKIKTHQSHVKSPETENDEVVKLWKDEAQSNNNCFLEWIDQTRNVHIHPPEDTLAVVVHVLSKRGAMFIHETDGGDYVDGVGAEDTESSVIVPWDNQWYYDTGGCKNGAWFAMLFVSSEVGTLDHKWLGL
ncbi:hypothetical protein V6Z92_007739 [Aspergillus fumigatus]